MAIVITTKTGDKGESGLANGQRVSKAEPVFEAIGSVDELNSWLGFVVAVMKPSYAELATKLEKIQEQLFYVGAELAQSPTKFKKEALDELETYCKGLESQLEDEWHQQFLLPGGTELGGQLDIARAVCRRCERRIVEYLAETNTTSAVSAYINRLSDYLYLVRCFINHEESYIEKKFIKQ